MATIVTRAGKGSALSHNEVDANFTNLNSDKLEANSNITVADATVTGDLTVQGTTTTLNTATLQVEDKNITLNYSTGDSSGAADGAGITIQDAVSSSTDATILWDATNDTFDFSHAIQVQGLVDIASGEIGLKNSGSVSNIKFYCEVSNAHYTALQSSPHSAYSGNVTLTLPPATDTLVGRDTTDTLTNKTLTSPVLSGNVGVSATNPQKALHVLGGVLAATSDGSTSGITIDSTATAGYASTITHSDTGIEFDTGSTLRDFTFDVSGSELMRIDTSSGNVGIGGSPVSSTRRLMIKDTGDVRVDIRSGADTNLGAIDFSDTSNTARGQFVYDHNDDSMQFTTLSTERMRIDSSGRLLLGTTSSNGSFISSNHTQMNIQGNASGAIGSLMIRSKGTTNATTFELAASDGVAASYLWNGSASAMVFATNNTERMRLNASGSLIVGATSAGNGKVTSVSSIAFEARSSTKPYYQWYNSGAGTDLKYWRCGNNTDGGLDWSTVNDAYSAAAVRMRISGTGTLTVNGDAIFGSSTAKIKTYSDSTYSGIFNGSSLISDESIYFGAGSLFVYLDGAERMRLTSTGLGIGTSGPSYPIDVRESTGDAAIRVLHSGTGSSDDSIVRIQITGTTATSSIFFGDGTDADVGKIVYAHNGNTMRFFASAAEVMRMSGAGLYVGATSLGQDGISILPRYSGSSTTSQIRWNRAATSTSGTALLFMDGGVIKGYVNYNNSSTTYSTTSDQRVKENIVDAPAGNIDEIRIRSFDWKVDGSHQKYGVIAQELVGVAPEAVSVGDDEAGTMCVDHSKLVPMMIKEIQDLKAAVSALRGA